MNSKDKSITEIIEELIYHSYCPNPKNFAIILSTANYKALLEEVKEQLLICSGIELNEKDNIYYKGYLIIKEKKI